VRRRTVRDLGTIAGVLVILLVLVSANTYFGLEQRRDKAIKFRKAVEAAKIAEGVDLVNWELFQATKGSIRKGATYVEDLQKIDEMPVNIVGYMVPINQFRSVDNFMLLPMPLDCYFCESPPMRDIIMIQLKPGEVVDLAEEPVLIGGQLHLNEGTNQKFFYTIDYAVLGPALETEILTRKRISEEHREHMRANDLQDVLSEEDKAGELIEGTGADSPSD
jgi:hypothetical protein